MPETEDAAYYSDICVNECGGLCCDPWWGIISYTVKKPGGLDGMAEFEKKLARGILEREERIVRGYMTREDPPRPLFSRPEKYNVRLGSIRAEGTTLVLELLAMYAFRCNFLEEGNACGVHPSIIGGEDIRPPHCGFMGSPGASPGEKGYCRILHAACESRGRDAGAVSKAIEVEKGSAEAHLSGGFDTAGEAAKGVVEELRRWCEANAPRLAQKRAPAKAGRNDPCPCGSGRKFKKCCGR